MFQIFENGKAVAKMQTREELFRYFIRRDLNIYICTTDRIMSYTPSVFQLLAMNPNDQYAPGACYGFLGGCRPTLYPRPIMILEDGRPVEGSGRESHLWSQFQRWVQAQVPAHVPPAQGLQAVAAGPLPCRC